MKNENIIVAGHSAAESRPKDNITRRGTRMVVEGGYSICKCRFRFGLTFRSSLPREPAIEAPSFQTVNKCPAKRRPKNVPLPPSPLFLPVKSSRQCL